ncbi:MAG: hypothetical protein E7599_04375 [Ruminococcaceae bacterium]|nr:hypothetical protein [Oscillospiraceae bacterium]
MDNLQEFKCPCCDGAITFDSKTQKMKCPYCDTELEIEAVKAYNEEMATGAEDNLSWDTSAGAQWQEDELTGLLVYACESCGGEIVGEETTGATTCPFCGNAVVMKGAFAGDLKPDLVIPFKLSKADAKRALQRHYNKRLVPKLFKSENRIDEVKGVYVPFWLFDAKADAKMRYRATRVRFWSDSHYNYTSTRHYLVMRAGNLSFAGVPVDGSEKMDDTLMESIEPFDLSQAVDFETAYLAGYFADKYDVSAEDSVERANERVKQSTADALASTVIGYQSVRPVSSSIQLSEGRARYALYPVWLLNTTWNGEKYTFAMNGQTGKMIGDLPMDKGAFARWLLGVTAIGTAAAFALSYLLWMWL